MSENKQNSTFSVQQDLLAKANKALKKAKNIEQGRIKQGWQWVKIGKLTKILVPCDKNGKPTEEAQRRIDRLKGRINIIL